MKRRTDKRREKVLAYIESPRTVKEVHVECGITYLNAYYTLQSLRDDRKCHIVRWETHNGNKPQAVFVAGEGYDAVLGGDDGRPQEEILESDRAIRRAVNSWVRRTEDDEE